MQKQENKQTITNDITSFLEYVKRILVLKCYVKFDTHKLKSDTSLTTGPYELAPNKRIELIQHIEESIGIEFSQSELKKDNFENVNKIYQLVSKKWSTL